MDFVLSNNSADQICDKSNPPCQTSKWKITEVRIWPNIFTNAKLTDFWIWIMGKYVHIFVNQILFLSYVSKYIALLSSKFRKI